MCFKHHNNNICTSAFILHAIGSQIYPRKWIVTDCDNDFLYAAKFSCPMQLFAYLGDFYPAS